MILKKKDFVVHGEKEVCITSRDLNLIFTALSHYRQICIDFSLIDRNIDKTDDYYIIRRDICDLCEKLQNLN